MNTEKKQLTTEQTLMQEVVNRISDKYTPAQNDLLISNAKKITDAILNYSNENKANK